ncbi:MAG: hypothetical protein Q8R00_04945 [Candidatus Nanoarchaeia archaeon]|nr:hypothetical protein [Candidatus Nanoarchaeia archaeon]
MKKLLFLILILVLATSVSAENCTDGQKQPCGPDTDEGVCSFGIQTCSNDEWGLCLGAVYPTDEIKDNKDNDCDGEIDEGFECNSGELRQCGESNIGICKYGTERCVDGSWTGVCEESVFPEEEICGDGLDNDCDSFIDEDCSDVGSPQTCFNKIKDENELGVDCGGSCSVSCPVCIEGEIKRSCYCDSEIYDSGYCCSSKYSEKECKIKETIKSIDLDKDGLTTEQELEKGTDPKKPDTDNDGILDSEDNLPLCGNNICDAIYGENLDNCPRDCESVYFVPWYVYFIVLILFIAAIMFFRKLLQKPKETFNVPVITSKKDLKVRLKESRIRSKPNKLEKELRKIK